MSAGDGAYFPPGSHFAIREALRTAGYEVVSETARETKRLDIVCSKGGRKITFCVSSVQADGSSSVVCLAKRKDKDLLKEAIDMLRSHGGIDVATYEAQKSVQQSAGGNAAPPRASA